MRHITLISLLLLIASCTGYGQISQSKMAPFLLSGKVKDRDTGIIVFWHPINDSYVYDTARLDKGHFQFSGDLKEPTFCWLFGSKKDGNSTSFFLEAGKQYISLEENNFDRFAMSGSFTQRQEDTLKNKIRAVKT